MGSRSGKSNCSVEESFAIMSRINLKQAIDPASGNGVPERGLSWSNYPHRYRVPERLPGIVNAMDRPLLYILIALSVTLLLFAVGVFPYPFGLILLILLALGRFLQIRGPA